MLSEGIVNASVGGALIGIASLILLLGIGQIAGISGIFTGAIFANRAGSNIWRWAFLVGLFGSSAVFYYFLSPENAVVVTKNLDLPIWLYALAGLVVGIGVNTANGCTSGHGVCGIGRMSARSIVATIIFMVMAITTVFVTSWLFGAG
ncbi:MAG: YeeE/YedE family protein [Alteromonadaceae bacterium]|nr:YeeE/YedE family protein [Alteromonadaceae bacterium]